MEGLKEKVEKIFHPESKSKGQRIERKFNDQISIQNLQNRSFKEKEEKTGLEDVGVREIIQTQPLMEWLAFSNESPKQLPSMNNEEQITHNR